MQFGNKINGKLVPFTGTFDTLPTTKPSETFEFEIQTEGIPDETATIQQLLTLEQQIPDLKILHINTDRVTGNITMQITDTGPGDISLAGLLSTIPSVMVLVFVIVTAIAIWYLYGQNPILVLLLTILGGAAVFYLLLGTQIRGLPAPGKIRTSTSETLKTEGVASAQINLESWRKSAQSQRRSAEIGIENAQKEIKEEMKKKQPNKALTTQLESEIIQSKTEIAQANKALNEIGILEKQLAEAHIKRVRKGK